MTASNTPPSNSTGLRANLWLLSIARNWLRIALVVLGLYALLPFAAPTLMKLGATGPARFLYTIYSPFCHQFAFRTFFLYGEQHAYPRDLADSDLAPFETEIATTDEYRAALEPYLLLGNQPIGTFENFNPYLFTPAMQFASRDFLGTPELGYKMTLCERDTAIYLTMLLGGLLYSIPYIRTRIRPVPIWLYLILGIAPIGIDGFSQLLGTLPPGLNPWPPRESSPLFRTGTGALFGLMNAWLAFPYFELSMRETRDQIEAKLARAGFPVKQ